MKNLILSILLIVTTMSYAQYDEDYLNKLVSDFTTSLEGEGVNTYLISKRYCMGSVEIFDLGDGKRCVSKGSYYEVYVFWQEDDQAKLKMIDNCGEYVTLNLDSNEVLEFMTQYKNDIKINPIKSYEIATKDSGPKQSTKIHACYRLISYKDKDGMKIDQSYNLFDLTSDALEPNLNYEYNNGLKLLELEKLLDSMIDLKTEAFRRA